MTVARLMHRLLGLSLLACLTLIGVLGIASIASAELKGVPNCPGCSLHKVEWKYKWKEQSGQCVSYGGLEVVDLDFDLTYRLYVTSVTNEEMYVDRLEIIVDNRLGFADRVGPSLGGSYAIWTNRSDDKTTRYSIWISGKKFENDAPFLFFKGSDANRKTITFKVQDWVTNEGGFFYLFNRIIHSDSGCAWLGEQSFVPCGLLEAGACGTAPTSTTTTTRPSTTTTTRPRNTTTTTTRPPTTTTTTLPKNRAPQITGVSPADGGLAYTNTPVLSVTAKDPDKDPLRFFFRVEGDGVAVESGWIDGPHWQVPPYLLDPTETYRWWVSVEDARGLQANSGLLTFRVAFMPVASEMVATPDGQGYWTVDTEGQVRRFGSAKDYGSLKKGLVQNIIGMARTPDGGGYWLVGSDGGVFNYGNAGFYQSMGGQPLNAPIVAMAPTPDGGGYWLVAKDGGVFNFGNAPFFGSMGGTRLNAPVVGMAPTKHGRGYWLAAQDGGVFRFGDAVFYGSTGGTALNYPVTDIAPHPTGEGYWLVAEDGGVFAFGAARFSESMAGKALNGRIVAMETTPDGGGYWLLGCDGGIFTFGNAPFFGSPEPKYACRGIPALSGKPIPPPVTTPPSSLPACMALKAANGQYVTAAQGGGTSVSVTAVVSGPEASFRVIPVGDRFGLRTTNGVYFLVAEGGGGRADGNAMRANRWATGPWEQFAAERIGANHLALRTATGHYVTAELGGGAHLATNRTTADAWERFEIVPQPDSFCPDPAPPTSLRGGAVLSRHTQLTVGSFVQSPSDNAFVTFQGDGNVVLYARQGSNIIPLWATGTSGQPTSSFVMQADGNLVLYGANGAPWATRTAGFPETWAQVQDDCNFVLYGPGATPLWASNTQCPGPPPPPPTPISWCGHTGKSDQYGPLRYCYRGTTASAEAGFYSPLTGGFSPAVGPWPTRDTAVHEFWSATIDSPDVFYFVGGPSVDTGYGPVSYGEQRWPTSGFGPVLRWGAFNFLTGKFYPSHGWMQDLG